PTPLIEYVPLQYDPKGGKIITQYDMHAVDDVGLLKFDFLGIRNLSILGDAVRLAKEHRNADVNIEKIPLDDKKTFELLARGETMGLFQLGGSGMTKYLKDLKPSSIHDINAMVALYRPGPIESIPAYIERKHNPQLVRYLDPRMKEILDQSHGVITYQDDVLLIAIKIAGYSWLEADKLRKAMGKKIPAEMRAQKEKFTKGSIENGLPASKAEELWRLIEPFAAYGFNKCVTGDSELSDAKTGEKFTVEELYNSKRLPQILSCEKDLTLRSKNITVVQQNGVKPVYKITTRRGLSLKATVNHPFLKFSGWTELQNLKIGDRIATARIAPTPKGLYAIEDYRLATLGYLLAEGNVCHPHGIYFYSKEKKEIRDFINYARQFPNIQTTINRSKSAASVYVGKKEQKKSNELREWLKKIDLLGKNALSKKFPRFVFQLHAQQLALLIGKMWQGDGCVHDGREDSMIYYATSSKSIAYDMQHLLLRLGIVSTVHRKVFSYRESKRLGWTIHVSRYTNLNTFASTVGVHLIGEPKRTLEKIISNHPVLSSTLEPHGARGSKDIVPIGVLPIVKEEIYKGYETLRGFAAANGISPRLLWQDRQKTGYLRETISRLGTLLHSRVLLGIANSDVYWDEIVAIEQMDSEMTYDITIPDNHNFVANDILVHNSHAASYGRVAYQTAYMKANFPGEYMTAVLTADSGDIEKIAEIIDETKRMGIPVLPPDVNESYAQFTLIKGLDDASDTIRFGLESVKNVGTNIVQAIIEARVERGKFSSIADFAERVHHKDFNKK
ncbi:MAG TPA: LAGLIDADG family homing endonuclease, partial [Candidatus Paceibacterota bacterium]